MRVTDYIRRVSLLMIAVMVITQVITVVALFNIASEAHHCHHGLFACPPDCEHHRDRDRTDPAEKELSFTQCQSNSATTLIPKMSNAVVTGQERCLLSDAPGLFAELVPAKSVGHAPGVFRPPGLI